MAKNDGGPVFPQCPGDPRTPQHSYASVYGGMTLRDWFAGQALTGLIARSVGATELTAKTIKTTWDVADAMLAERDKGSDK